jgi:exonuclease III
VNEGLLETCIDADIQDKTLGSDHCPISLTLDL